ncbi:MAG: 4-(cytidine 5'-diphospho)-2-C-methyl-D-erythritol kinase [Endomicrobia bacterium]|nr:4-(cytidine 5'-diphospho)-2-C-methyl-D-erythritol kinase [Endomicrobiia bacterium]
MIIIKAPAKVNFFLEITGKRPDGYHNLESIMQTVSLYDEITAEAVPSGINLECNNENLPSGSSNIVYKAAAAVQKRFNIQKGVKITLKKEIPVGAGLGGGSSDAAAAIKALVKLWNINAQKTELEQIAANLGADVPFFLTGGTALCEGIGDIVRQLRITNYELRMNDFSLPLVLVNPGFGVSTPSVYKKVRLPFTNPRKIDKIKKLIEQGAFNIETARQYCFNRLEDFVFNDHPEIKKIKDVLSSLNCASLMSGSGATVFGIYDRPDEHKIKTELEKYNWKFWFVKTVNSI